jgi:tetraacyldisaccharide 4'-kinase
MQNKKVVILSRGYGRIDGVKDDEASAFSDKSIIRLTGANRAKLGAMACKEHSPDVIILDDGFQHLRIKRDIDIVMIDCLNPFGNYQLLPAGILREDLKALKRASVLVLAHSDLVSDAELSKINNFLSRFGKPIIKSIHKPVSLVSVSGDKKEITPQELKGKKVWAFCGIGNPDSFLLTLNKLDVSLRGISLFPDHYMYVESDIEELISQFREANAEYIVTTMKDMAKVKPLFSNSPILVYALRIELDIIDGEDKLKEVYL